MSRPRRPAGRFLWPPRHLPPAAFETAVLRELFDEAERVAEARAKADEPECIGRAILDTYGADALYFQSVRHAQAVAEGRAARVLLSIEDRLRDAQRRAKEQQRRDLRSEFRLVEEMLQRDRRGGRSGLAVLRRLEAVELSLDRVPPAFREAA